MNSKLMRLNRAISQAGICSRRHADKLIKQGEVKVNGQVINEPGIKINIQKDTIEVLNKKITPNTLCKKTPIYLALYKPIKVVTTLSDPQNRKTIKDLLPYNLKNSGVVPIGRLDYFSEGLLLLSNDGDFVYKMSHPSFHLPKVYLVEIKGNVYPKHILAIKKGLYLKDIDIKLAPLRLDIVKKIPNNTYILKFTLEQGINRQIRRMCKVFNWKIRWLKRISHGPIKLKGLKPGKFRYLSNREIEMCIKQLSQKVSV